MNAQTMFLVAAALALGACTTTPQNLDAQMGHSVDMLKALQIANPQAAADTRPVEGIDGKAADALVDRYHKTFSTPQPTVNVYSIGIGSGGAGTTQ
jgi:hypothetical protein